MYYLTLTPEERHEIDWISYHEGQYDDLFLALMGALTSPDVDWGFGGNITFICSESIAWAIKKIGKACNYLWDCFSSELAAKLTNFCKKVV